MIITINEVPLSKNKYVNMHWAKRKTYKTLIFWLIEEALLNKKRPKYKKAKLTFNIYFKTKRKRDVANFLGGGLIAWIDVLVDQNIIVDDCYDVIGQPNIIFNIDKDDPRTEIIIKGLEGGEK